VGCGDVRELLPVAWLAFSHRRRALLMSSVTGDAVRVLTLAEPCSLMSPFFGSCGAHSCVLASISTVE
jgi:hypothetical protein